MTVRIDRSPGRDEPTGNDISLATLAARMHTFVHGKGWYAEGSRRPQSPRNLALSVGIEAAELVECFQWADHADLEAVAGEMADVLLYLVQLANVTGIDLAAAAARKLDANISRTWNVEIGTHP